MRFIRILIPTVITVIAFLQSNAQTGYWQQELRYKIDVELNDEEHELDGFLQLDYRNNSPDTLSFIWFHLWPNAFKNDKTAFTEEQLRNGNTAFYFSDRSKRGYINRLDFKSGAVSLEVEDHPTHIDIIKVLLDRPLLPGSEITITTPFHVQLPYNFGGLGHNGTGGQSYQLTNWYPKPAVYDRSGWHPMPFLAGSPGYADFASFDVSVSLPQNYVVAASGDLKTPTEVDWLKTRAVAPERKKITAPKNKNSFKKPVSRLAEIPSEPNWKTLRYTATNVHDFALFADKYYVVRSVEINLASGKKVFANLFYHSENEQSWMNSLTTLSNALNLYSNKLTEYPFNSFNLVQAEMGDNAATAFPMIATVSAMKSQSSFDDVVEQQVGRQWFAGIIGSNERDAPWISKGFNTFYDMKPHRDSSANGGKAKSSGNLYPSDADELSRLEIEKKDQPIRTEAYKMSEENARLIAGHKTAVWLSLVEEKLGANTFGAVMKDFAARWQFRHPGIEDIQQSFENISQADLSGLFAKLDSTGPLLTLNRQPKIVTIFSRFGFPNAMQRHSQTDQVNSGNTTTDGIKSHTSTDYIEIVPVPAYNMSDGFMIGAAVHNYRLPYSRFHFFVSPLYATKSQQINGLSYFDYALYPRGAFQRVSLGAGVERFSTLSGVDSNGKRITSGFFKFSPSVKAVFKNNSLSDTRESAIEWKTFVIGENGFNYFEKLSEGSYYPAKSGTAFRYLNQLTYSISDSRVLYPYRLNLQAQQAKDFYRVNIEADYLFNYAKGGGMNIRFFAAKFGYVGNPSPAKRFATFRYQPKLTAVRGDEDYTYSNYFVGRNESEGIASQQIMMRDGGLKIRTDMFQDLQGRSDDWVTSLNFNTTIPAGILPAVVPLRLFFDIGTYAGAWEKDANETRFLYVGGLQLSLFKNILNIYAPLIYSKSFSDNLKTVPEENKFFRKVSFSIDIHRLSHRKMMGDRLSF